MAGGRLFRGSLGVIFIVALAGPAHASYSVSARTEVQLYNIPSITGAQTPYSLSQQRLVQYLGFGAFDLGSKGPDERIDFVASLRLDENFGLSTNESRALGIDQPQLQLMYGYLQWTGGLHGLLDARLGRQIVMRDFTPWGLDGLSVTVHTPVHLGITAEGGFLLTGSSPLGYNNFAPDGVRQSDGQRLAAGAPGNLLTANAQTVAYAWLDNAQPVFGGRLDLEGVPGVILGAAYRQAQSHTSGPDVTALPSGAQGYQVTQQLFDAAGSWQVMKPWELYGAVEQDLFLERTAGARLGTRVQVIPYRLTGVLEWSYYHPSFSADSIFNLFNTGPYQDVELRADASPKGPWLYKLGLLASGFTDAAGTNEPAGTTNWLPGITASAVTKPGRTLRGGAELSYTGNPWGGKVGDPQYLGKQFWLILSGGIDVVPRVSAADLRLSAAEISDPYQPRLQGLWSWDAALISTNYLTRVAQLLLIGEASSNRILPFNLQGYAVLQIQADFR